MPFSVTYLPFKSISTVPLPARALPAVDNVWKSYFSLPVASASKDKVNRYNVTNPDFFIVRDRWRVGLVGWVGVGVEEFNKESEDDI